MQSCLPCVAFGALTARARRRPQHPPAVPPASPPALSLVDALCEDVSSGGGASLAAICGFLTVWEILFSARPASRRLCSAAHASLAEGPGAPFCVGEEDLEDFGYSDERRFFNKGAGIIDRVLRTTPVPIVKLSVPSGICDAEVRSWAAAGLLRAAEELHFLGSGLSDAGLAHLAVKCPRLRRITVPCGSVSVAAALVLHAHLERVLLPAWWAGLSGSPSRSLRLRVLPRLRRACQAPGLKVQRVPEWFCGKWSPSIPFWGSEVHHFDSLGRFTFMRNGQVERVGVVRSYVPSPFGRWWEVDLCFFVQDEWFTQLLLVLPISTLDPGKESHKLELRIAVVGPSDHVRQHPRQFPHNSREIREWQCVDPKADVEEVFSWDSQRWVDAAVASSIDDTDAAMLFEDSDSSDGEAEVAVPSMQDLLAQLDMEEAYDSANQPSRRAEGPGFLPSVEEFLAQLEVEEARDISRAEE